MSFQEKIVIIDELDAQYLYDYEEAPESAAFTLERAEEITSTEYEDRVEYVIRIGNELYSSVRYSGSSGFNDSYWETTVETSRFEPGEVIHKLALDSLVKNSDVLFTLINVSDAEADTTLNVNNVLDEKVSINEGEPITVRQYFARLLSVLWDDEESFSGKRPFGNSDWSYGDICVPIAERHGKTWQDVQALIKEALQTQF